MMAIGAAAMLLQVGNVYLPDYDGYDECFLFW